MRMNEAEAKEELGLVPDVRDVFHNGDLRKVSKLIDQRIELSAMKKQAEEEIKELDAKLTEMLSGADVQRVMHGTYKAQLVAGTNSHISKELLLEKGVSASVIVAATKVKNYTYVLISDTETKR